MATTADKLVKQFEFYFSDSNLPNDKFLKQELADNDGWARLSVLGSFQRVKAIETDLAAIAEALKTSTKLEVSEDALKVRRTAALADNIDLTPQTIFIKGLDAAWGLDEVTSFLESKGVAPQCVRLQFVKEEGNKKRTGAAWVELASADAAKAAAELKITVEGAEEPLSIQLKSALQDAKKAAKEAVEAAAAEAAAAEAAAEAAEAAFVADHLLTVSNLGGDASRETIKGWVEKAGAKSQYVDYERGLPQATIRLTKDASAPKAAAVVAALSALPASEISGGADGAAVFAVVKADDEAKVWAVLEEKRAALKAAMAARGAQGQGGNKRRMGGSHGTKRTRR